VWKSTILANVVPLSVNSRRICAVRVCSSNWKLLLVNVYMSYENDSVSTEEFAQLISVSDDLIITYSDYNVVICGEFNVDFSRDWVHTALLNSFCDSIGLTPIVRHPICNMDYSYNFNIRRFSILDHFLLSGSLYYHCVF